MEYVLCGYKPMEFTIELGPAEEQFGRAGSKTGCGVRRELAFTKKLGGCLSPSFLMHAMG